MERKIILALDNLTEATAYPLVDKILCMREKTGDPLIWGVKLGDLVAECGLSIVRNIKAKGFKVMADPKLFDIPSRIKSSLDKLISAGADIVTVHCSSLYEASKEESPYIAGVTVLTSFDTVDTKFLYKSSIKEMVSELATLAEQYYGNLVCAPTELLSLKDNTLTKIVPGIRPLTYTNKDDQYRKSTPDKAIQNGADLLVIGRPILQSKDMFEVIRSINALIA